MKTLPGVDVVLGAKLLVAIGTDRERFTTAHELGAGRALPLIPNPPGNTTVSIFALVS